jgi:hypothetical protein
MLFSFKIEPELIKAIRDMSTLNEQTMAQFIRQACKDRLKSLSQAQRRQPQADLCSRPRLSVGCDIRRLGFCNVAQYK